MTNAIFAWIVALILVGLLVAYTQLPVLVLVGVIVLMLLWAIVEWGGR